MKTLKEITNGFENCSVQSVELENGIKYFFCNDFEDYKVIKRYNYGYFVNEKIYKNENSFLNSIKRHLKKQTN